MSNYTIENLIAATAGEGRVPAIKIGSQVFPLQVSGGGGGGSTDFYKCASVSGPYTEIYYAVSGAGMGAVNGNYTDNGTTSGGKPVYSYTNSGTTYYLFYDSGWEAWFIYNSTTFSDYAMDECYYYKSDWEESWYTGGGGSGNAPSVTLTTETHDLPKTWTGYKAVYNSATGTYSFAGTATSGLTWDIIKPVIGKIYTADAMIEIASLFTGLPTDYVLYHPLSSAEASVGGYSCTYSNVTFETDSTLGETVAVFNGDGRLTISSVAGSAAIAFSIFQKIEANTGDNHTVVMRDHFGILSAPLYTGVFDFAGMDLQHNFANTGWHHIYGDYANGVTRLFIDGQQAAINTSFTYNYTSASDVQMGVHFNEISYPLTGKLKAFRMYNRALNTAEIAALANEFSA